jgi:NAD(P)H-dependent FMN reductase
MAQPRILAFAGSAREQSFNKKLVAVAAKAAEAAGAEVTLIDLRDYPLPLMDEDLEAAEGVPEPAKKLKELMKAHDGFLIACPEYNSSITPLLKNVIDWCSRREGDEKPLECYQGKTAALLSASPGGLGGLRGLVHVRAILGNIGVLVLPKQYALSGAGKAFDAEGNLTDEDVRSRAESVGTALAETLKKLV